MEGPLFTSIIMGGRVINLHRCHRSDPSWFSAGWFRGFFLLTCLRNCLPPGWISRFASATQTFAPRRRFHVLTWVHGWQWLKTTLSTPPRFDSSPLAPKEWQWLEDGPFLSNNSYINFQGRGFRCSIFWVCEGQTASL